MASYNAGTLAAITAGERTVTFATASLMSNASKDDLLVFRGVTGVIDEIVSNTELTLLYPWAGETAVMATDWSIQQLSGRWSTALALNERLQELVQRVDTDVTGFGAGAQQLEGDGFDQSRELKDYLGDSINIAQYVRDPGDPTKAFSQLMRAIEKAVALDRPLMATRVMPAIEIGTNKIIVPSGLKFIASGRPLRIKHTHSVAFEGNAVEDVTIQNLLFIGAHNEASGDPNGYTCQFSDSSDLDLKLRFMNGNSGLLLTDCLEARADVQALNMVANGAAVKGWKSKAITLAIDVLNAKGFGLYGSDGGCNVHVTSLRKRYNEAAMTQYLLDSRSYNLFQWGGAVDSPNNVWRYHLGLEGLGLTVWTSHWTVDYVYIERTADNGISLSGDHNIVKSGLVTGCRHDGVHSYGQTNDATGVTARNSGYRSSTNGSAIAGYGFNASGSAGAIPYAVTFNQCRSEGNIRGDFNFDGGTFTDVWTAGGIPTRQYCYWEDGTWGYVFYSGGPVPAAFGTVSPAAAGWAFNEAVNASEQAIWSDGVTAWRYRSRAPAGGGTYATQCRVDPTCIATHSNAALRYIDSAPAVAGNIFATGSGTALKSTNADATLSTSGTFKITANGSNVTNRPVLEFARANGTYSAPTDVTVSAILGEIRASGYLDSAWQTAGYIRAVAGQISGGQIRPSWLFFYKDAVGAHQEALRINYDGALWADAYAYDAEQELTAVTGNAIAISQAMVSVNPAEAVSISQITTAIVGSFIVNIRNPSANAVTIVHGNNGIRLNGKANLVLAQHQSLTVRRVGNTGSVWQQM
ncbi:MULTISPECIES: hypothetical protein [unclassified Chelatococcus]|uniref:hypothetical protein n=1 Tax=unclassified Chelatococcus TaxID=2638111 RepID=UPI001BD0B2A2|nr:MULTISPECIES: hypothetical protein [unclassified Chelatococcus]MBS7698781.1 hypothetical protein [Chelatococcus sp. YT9]MBX3554637.1 hypothetical protein [Chelatococcus sp.]